MKKQKLKKERGITLIALVITIIVLLILAGVAISMLSGENGILKQAIAAKENTETATNNEMEKLKSAELQMLFTTKNSKLNTKISNGYIVGATGSDSTDGGIEKKFAEYKEIFENNGYTVDDSHKGYFRVSDSKEGKFTVIRMYGDVDNDGVLSTADFTALNNYFYGAELNFYDDSDIQKLVADVNFDGIINIEDAGIILGKMSDSKITIDFNHPAQDPKNIVFEEPEKTYEKNLSLLPNTYIKIYDEEEDKYYMQIDPKNVLTVENLKDIYSGKYVNVYTHKVLSNGNTRKIELKTGKISDGDILKINGIEMAYFKMPNTETE